jgi:SAM-dependent methyltransferase
MAPIWGGVVARAVTYAIQKLWPDMKDRRVLVYGFGYPYIDLFQKTDRIVYLMPPDQGGFPWPEGEKNLLAISARTELPIESNSLDGVILVHSLEFTNAIEPHFEEIWRVLKSNGRVMVIVPNRMGFWARADHTPFGQGSPFSLYQVHRYLRAALFIPERHLPILYTLPIRWSLLLRLSPFLEKYGRFIYPSFAGLHVVEAAKQVYAGLAMPVKERARVRGEVLVGVAPQPQTHHPANTPGQSD